MFRFPQSCEHAHPIRVVGFVSSSSSSTTSTFSSNFVNEFLNKNVFEAQSRESVSELIEGFYNAKDQTVVLRMICPHAKPETDSALVEALKCKAMLFLFLVSHVVVVLHPNARIDVNLFRELRILEDLNQHMHRFAGADFPPICDTLLSKPPPLLLFLFQQPKLTSCAFQDFATKVKNAYEGQIFRGFHKANLLCVQESLRQETTSLVPLFELPRGELIHFFSPQNQLGEELNSSSSHPSKLIPSSIMALLDTSLSSSFYLLSSSKGSLFSSHSLGSSSSYGGSSFSPLYNVSLKHFDLTHSNAAFRSALFTQLLARPPLQLSYWMKAASLFYEFFFPSEKSSALAKASLSQLSFEENLRRLVDFEGGFCLQLCENAYPLALDAYSSDLPSHYTLAYHKQKFLHALSIFNGRVRGACREKFVSQLENECEEIWQKKRNCEALSLTGAPCCLPYHLVPDEVLAEEKANELDLPVEAHRSAKLWTVSCLCGATSTVVADPFNVSLANKFSPKAPCCLSAIKEITSLSFEMTSQSSGDSGVKTSLPKPSSPQTFTSTSIAHQMRSTSSSSSLNHRFSEDDGGDTLNNGRVGPLDYPAVFDENVNCEIQIIRLLSQAGRDYSPTVGVYNKAAYVSGTHYLLPWDVSAVSVHEHDKGLSVPSKDLSLKDQSLKATVNARFYIGYEYECEHGHRFMMAANDKPVRMSSSGYVKGTAGKLMKSDMCVFLPCLIPDCVLARLRKVHIVTPEAILPIFVNPRFSLGSHGLCSLESPLPHLENNTYHILDLPKVMFFNGKEIRLSVAEQEACFFLRDLIQIR